MSKHTPGPWFVYEDCSRVGAEGAKNIETGIAGKYVTESLFDRQGNIYNPHDARLIAAAPELLEALTRILGALKTEQRINGGLDPRYTTIDIPRAIQIAETAIAKATGADK